MQHLSGSEELLLPTTLIQNDMQKLSFLTGGGAGAGSGAAGGGGGGGGEGGGRELGLGVELRHP